MWQQGRGRGRGEESLLGSVLVPAREWLTMDWSQQRRSVGEWVQVDGKCKGSRLSRSLPMFLSFADGYR